ncbi:hypothetical protein Tco_0196707 [Tanacetum coccineum]
MNTKFVNNLPAYWGKYVTNVKQNMDISTTPYVQIYTHLKAYEPHAKKTLKKQEQSTSIVDPLAYVAHTTSAPAISSPSTPSRQPTAKGSSCNNDIQVLEEEGGYVKLQEEKEMLLGASDYNNMFQANHEDAYDSDVDEGPNAVLAFMANLSSTGATNNAVNETEMMTIRIPVSSVIFLDTEAQYDPTKDILGTRNPGLGYMAKRAQPVLYDADTFLHPAHHPVSIWDSEDVLVHQVSTSISNCLCKDLRSACDREHTKVLELEAEVLKQQKMVIESEKRNSHLQKTHIDLQLKFQNYKQCIDTSSASNAIFEINKLRKQLQGKDDTIRNLDAQINIMKVLNVGSTEGSCDQQALETDRIQLKDTITSLRIQLDGLKVENVSLQRRYDELSKANTHSRTAYTEKLSAYC